MEMQRHYRESHRLSSIWSAPGTEAVPIDVVKATSKGISAQFDGQTAWAKALSLEDPSQETVEMTSRQFSKPEIKQAQEDDPNIRRIIHYKNLGRLPTRTERKAEGKLVKSLLHEWGKLHVDVDGIVWRKTVSRKQLVIPQRLKQLVYTELHNNAGHLGPERVN